MLRVPEIIVAFWIIKALSTALGESTTDYLVTAIDPQIAVGFGFIGFVAALVLQLRTQRYVAWVYWLTVVMVGVFGTMAADVAHVVIGIPYAVSTVLYAGALAAVFGLWWLTEKSLSIHEINTPRRELFYWATVAATFATGTALGDFTANTLHLGYLTSALLFAALLVVPFLGWRMLGANPVVCFWTAYVITRPLGASVADWLGKPAHAGGVGVGDGPVSAVIAVAIAAMVVYLTVSKADVQTSEDPQSLGERHLEPVRP